MPNRQPNYCDKLLNSKRSRSDQISQTFFHNVAATWRTQRT